MSVMLYKVSEGKCPNKVKVKGVEYDYLVVDSEGVDKAIGEGWGETPWLDTEKGSAKKGTIDIKDDVKIASDENIEVVEENVKDSDGDGFIDGSNEEESLRDEYEQKSGKKPDGRWGVDRLKEEIDKL